MRNIRYALLCLIILLITNNMNAQNTVLNAREQHIAGISSLTAVGDMENLRKELNAGLDNGLTVNEIKEILTQLYAYCGFPRSLNATSAFMSVLEERKSRGIQDTEGKPIVVENNVPDKYEQGRKVLETLTKMPQPKPARGFGEFVPRTDAFLKEHLFADIFASDVLSFRQRELATISALAAMQGVSPQLQSHIAMGRNTGITDAQLAEISDLVEKHVSRSQANTMRKLLQRPETPLIEKDMLVRISEIEIHPEYLDRYNAILKEEAETSVNIEPGVIAIYPMQQKNDPTQIRIVEIYANQDAYQSHLQTPHFQFYKTGTLKMVKSLKLIDMESLDEETMANIFKKLE